MVTLITEQLCKQSLEERYDKAFSFNVKAVSLTQTNSFFFKLKQKQPLISLAFLHFHFSHCLQWAPVPLFPGVLVGRDKASSFCINHLLSLLQFQRAALSHVTTLTFSETTLATSSSSRGQPPDDSCRLGSLWPPPHSREHLRSMHVSFTDESLQTSPPPPPPKRHCRSLSVPEDLFQCRSNWHPSASKVWTPVKRGCQSRGASISGSAVNAFPLCAHSSSFTSSSLNSSSSPTFFSLALSSDSPLPWSFSWDPCDTLKGACSTSFATPSSCSSSPAPLIPHSVLQRRFSLSPVHIQDTQVVLRPPQPCPASALAQGSSGSEHPALSQSPTSACSTPSSSRRNMRPALPRCHSQPCDMRKPRLKRRYDADVPPYTRPGLDFGKMTQVRQTTQGYVKCNWG